MEKVTLAEARGRPSQGLRLGFGNETGEGTVNPPQIPFLFPTRVRPGCFEGRIKTCSSESKITND